MADALEGLTRRLDRTARALELRGSDGDLFTRRVTPTLQREVELSARSSFGADGVIIPGTGRATVEIDGKPRSGGFVVSILMKPAVTWIVGEVGTEPHVIQPRSGRGRRRVLAGALGHPLSVHVKHPGMPGRHAITNATKRIRAEQRRVVDEGISEVLQGAWRG